MVNIKLKIENKKISSHKGGFTLVEAMFAIFILTFVVVGLMTVVSSSLYSARYAKQEITMNFLIQEALDGIRNDRDNNVFLGDEPWQDFVDKYTGACEEGVGCQIEIGVEGVEDIIPCSDDDDCGKIYLDEEVAVPYNHDEGEDTYMRRYIVAREKIQELKNYEIDNGEGEIETISGENIPELEIEVHIIWKPRNSSLSKERPPVKMTLLDWRQ